MKFEQPRQSQQEHLAPSDGGSSHLNLNSICDEREINKNGTKVGCLPSDFPFADPQPIDKDPHCPPGTTNIYEVCVDNNSIKDNWIKDPSARETLLPDGDLYITREKGSFQALALHTGEGIKIDGKGNLALFDRDGIQAREGKMSAGKDSFSMVYPNGIVVTGRFDQSQLVRFPSGAQVLIDADGRVRTLQYPGSEAVPVTKERTRGKDEIIFDLDKR